MLQAAADFVGTNMRIMQVPVFFFFWNVVIFIGWIAAVVMVYSVGDIDNGPPGS